MHGGRGDFAAPYVGGYLNSFDLEGRNGELLRFYLFFAENCPNLHGINFDFHGINFERGGYIFDFGGRFFDLHG